MVEKRRYRHRARKTTPLQEVGFALAVTFTLLLVITYQQGMAPYNTGYALSALLIVALFMGISFYVFFLNKQRARQRALRALEISHIDTMKGEEFEEYVAELLKFRGYKTKTTPRSGDYGVDIIASKDGVKTAVQIKRYTRKLDQKPIREAVTGMAVKQYGCTKAMVITNSTFTTAAKFLASENNCILVDREQLAEWILAFRTI